MELGSQRETCVPETCWNIQPNTSKKNQTMSTSNYVHPEALVNTDWIVQHLNDPKVRIIESNEDVSLYDTGHIPGAVNVDWHRDLNDQSIRDFLDPEDFA